MARIRSPGYPSFPLEQVIEFASKIFAQDRQHPVDRATAARHMGFSGPSGASDRALSALMHFAMAEKVQKGELRITDASVRILHPNDAQERRETLHEVGFAPELFKELRDRYPEAPPSRDSLGSYLLRSGFASAAIPSATRAYLETCFYLQREGAYESGGNVVPTAPDSAPLPTMEPVPMTASATYATPPEPSAAAPPRAYGGVESAPPPALNKINMNVKGPQVHLEALLNRDGIARLRKKLESLEALLDDEEDSPLEEPGADDPNDVLG